MSTVVADTDGKRIILQFDYNPVWVQAVKNDLPGRTFVPREKGGPHWTAPLNLDSARRCREIFGEQMELTPKLAKWGRAALKGEKNLKSLSQADDAKLVKTPKRLAKWLRPYQRADALFMSQHNTLNANQPGAGKTAEWIAAMLEAGLVDGKHVVFGLLSSLDTVWCDEVRMVYKKAGLPEPTVLSGDTPDQRRKALAEATRLAAEGKGFWLILNHAMCRTERKAQEGTLGEGGKVLETTKFDEELKYPELLEIDADSLNVDEFHEMGLSNPSTNGHKGMKKLVKAARPEQIRCAMSGTPMGGKPIKLWGALNFLDPVAFSSKWNWARMWLKVSNNGFGTDIEGIQVGREADFYEHLKPYLIRRTKREVLPGLPPKLTIDVWCDMDPKQAKQYRKFEADAELVISEAEEEGNRLSATNILAQYTRLKQFADAYCDINSPWMDERFDVTPTSNSGKLRQLWEKLGEEGVLDPELDAGAVIASQFTGMVETVAAELTAKGIKVGCITGKTKQKDRSAIVRSFQRGGKDDVRVVVVNTKAGGSSITLDRADSTHTLDETWVPDQQEQVEDRIHRANDRTMAKAATRHYYYRTRKTIEEHIQKVVGDKQLNNRTILDLHRHMAKEASK